MASKTEGIALLSMYNDEDDEDEEEQQQNQETRIDEESNDLLQNIVSDPIQDQIPSKSPQNLSSPSPEIKSLRSPTPPPWPKSHRSSPMIWTAPSPGLPPRPPSERVAIVDYAHDEAAMSPEVEEGEIMSSGHVVISMEIQASNGYLEERTPPGTVLLLTPSIQMEPQPSDVPEQSRSENSMAIDSTGTDPEIPQAEIAIVVSEEVQKYDPLKKFLPPSVMTMCSEELQIKINKFLTYKKSGKSFNAALRNRKDYRNPDFLQHAVRYQDIDQIGTCFDKDVFDPHGYDRSDYFDEIEADMKREMERKEHERKKSQKVDFVPGGAQPGTVAPALKIGAQIPVAGISAVLTSGSQSVSAAADSAKEIRQNKKTKWDKIDGDVKNPMIPGGNDNLSSAGVHAATHLSAANAGTGYTAFAQQKRREAEEKRSGESKSKFDKRS